MHMGLKVTPPKTCALSGLLHSLESFENLFLPIEMQNYTRSANVFPSMK